MRFWSEHQLAAIVPLAGLALGAYYLFAFLPLSHRVDSLEDDLGKDWRKLVTDLRQPTNTVTLDFNNISNQLSETRQALAAVQLARKQGAARFEVGSDLRSKMGSVFQLFEFETQRDKRREDLVNLARQQHVALDEAEVSSGFPEFKMDTQQPSLLWPALYMADGLVATAIQCQVSAIHVLKSSSPSGGAPTRPAQIQFQLEVSGPAPSVLRLVRCLPLRGDELPAAGLTNGPPGKLPLLLDRFILKKQSPDTPNEVRAGLIVVGFVFTE